MRKDLSLEAVFEILHILSEHGLKLQDRVQKSIGSSIGVEVGDVNVNEAAALHATTDRLDHLIAERLLADCDNPELITRDDFEGIIQTLVEDLISASGEKVSYPEIVLVRRFLTSIIESTFDLKLRTQIANKNPRVHTWQAIDFIVESAEAEGIPPKEWLSRDEAFDKLTRHLFTKEEYIEEKVRAIHAILDPEVMWKIYGLPVIEMVVSSDPVFGESMFLPERSPNEDDEEPFGPRKRGDGDTIYTAGIRKMEKERLELARRQSSCHCSLSNWIKPEMRLWIGYVLKPAVSTHLLFL